MFEELSGWANLHSAFRRAAKGKRGQGTVAAFEHRLEDNLLDLQLELRSGAYQPGGYTNFFIHEPKRRLISAAPFRDRVVHHALCNIVEPIFERTFVVGSFANRRFKGTHRALDRAQECARRHQFVLQCDLEQFFPSVDHEILHNLLGAKISDGRVMDLVGRILASGERVQDCVYEPAFFEGDDLLALLRPRGLPIGNLTSQFWANVYLNPFDHFVTRELRCGAYVRYVDDLLLFADDTEQLLQMRAAIERRLARFRLRMHGGAHARPVSEGFPFLGFVVYPTRRRLKRRKGVHFRRCLAAMLEAERVGQCSRATISARVRSWLNHASYANTVGLRKAVLRDALRMAEQRSREPRPRPNVAVARRSVTRRTR